MAYVGGIALFSGAALGQSAETGPRFEIADVHVSARSSNAFPRGGPARGGRYEVKTATMVDLIRMAYGFDNDRIVGGPNWLEMDRFDVIAKVPPDSETETQKMLQGLLAERFKLVLHKDTRPLPSYALTAGKKPQLKQADGAGETGCRPQGASSGPPGEGRGGMLMMSNANGPVTRIALGPGMTVQYSCRNMTMASFAQGLRGMVGIGNILGNSPVRDETGLEGRWNFDVKWSLEFGFPATANAERITLFDALEKQLGLKLEERPVATEVIVVDSVNRKPSENPPGVAEALPPISSPSEFEVADVKSSAPSEMPMGRFQMQPGGRLVVQGMAMKFLLNRAFNTNNNDEVVGAPKWADTERFDITAKAPVTETSGPGLDMDAIAPMMRSLLVDRFRMTYHTEERQLSAYALVAAKPKMKKADPPAGPRANSPTCRRQARPPVHGRTSAKTLRWPNSRIVCGTWARDWAGRFLTIRGWRAAGISP
jgi:uncharacterized protein (TIGR03435 family)